MKQTGPITPFWLTLQVLLLALAGPIVNRAAGGPAAGESPLNGKSGPAAVTPASESAFFTRPAGACSLAEAARLIRDDARALALVDARLYDLIAPALDDYLEAAAHRRRFDVTLLSVMDLDDRRPEELRAALQSWHAAKPKLEGVLFVGNIKLPSFFLPRADIHSVRLWPRYFEDLDMTVTQRVAPGTVLKSSGTSSDWPKIVGVETLVVPPHDYDDLSEGPARGPELWTAFLPVGYAEPAKNNYAGWAGQLARFFKKATAFHRGEVNYGRGLYLGFQRSWSARARQARLGRGGRIADRVLRHQRERPRLVQGQSSRLSAREPGEI